MKQDVQQTWRIFSENLTLQSDSLSIEGDEFHYLANVLRLREEENLEISNGNGILAHASIVKITKKNALVAIHSVIEVQKQDFEMNICVGMPKPTAAEETVAGVAELGATKIVLFNADKTHIKQPLKLARLQKIAREATRISKAAWEPQLAFFANLEGLLKSIEGEFHTIIVCDESPLYDKWADSQSHETREHQHLLRFLQSHSLTSKIFVFIGPEASFSNKEREMLNHVKATPVSLGSHILRVPTAASAATNLLQAVLHGLRFNAR